MNHKHLSQNFITFSAAITRDCPWKKCDRIYDMDKFERRAII